MEIIARRYTSPSTPPRLVVGSPEAPSVPFASPVLCLRCGGSTRHAAPQLVSFDWGRVSPSNLRR